MKGQLRITILMISYLLSVSWLGGIPQRVQSGRNSRMELGIYYRNYTLY